MNKISFCSNIYVIPYRKFEALERFAEGNGLPNVDSPWTVDKAVSEEEEGISSYAYNCNLGGINNSKKLAMFHFLVDDDHVLKWHKSHTIDAMINKIRKMLGTFKKGEKLHALLTGGIQTNDSYKNGYQRSRENFEAIKTELESHGIKPSVLWGRKEFYTSLFYTAKGIDLNLNNREKLTINPDSWVVSAQNADIKSMDDLKNVFKVVEIAEGDSLIIDGNNQA